MNTEQKQALIERCNFMLKFAGEQVNLPEQRQVDVECYRAALAALTAEPVRYLNKFSGVCVSIEHQPNASEDEAVYLPLFTHPAPAADLAELVPDGWKLVPVEPTERMVIDGFESAPNKFFSSSEEWEAYEAMSGCQQAAYKARLCWAAMLAAAPDAESKNNHPGKCT